MSRCSAYGVVAKQLSMGIVDAVGGVPIQLLLRRKLGHISISIADQLAIIAAA